MTMPVTHHLLRLTCGLGLLLLVAAQEIVCTWPADEVVRVADQAIPGSPEDDSETEQPPLTLAATVPDVVAPRRSVPGRTRQGLHAGTATKALPNDTLRPSRFDPDTAAYLALDDSRITHRLPIRIMRPQRPCVARPQFLSSVWPAAPPSV